MWNAVPEAKVGPSGTRFAGAKSGFQPFLCDYAEPGPDRGVWPWAGLSRGNGSRRTVTQPAGGAAWGRTEG